MRWNRPKKSSLQLSPNSSKLVLMSYPVPLWFAAEVMHIVAIRQALGRGPGSLQTVQRKNTCSGKRALFWLAICQLAVFLLAAC